MASVLLPYVLMAVICFVSIYVLKQLIYSIEFNIILKPILLIVSAVVIQMIWLYVMGLQADEKTFFKKIVLRKR